MVADPDLSGLLVRLTRLGTPMAPLTTTPVAPLVLALVAGEVVAAGIPTTFASRVTAAVRANSRPSTAAPVVAVIEAKAIMVPFNTEPVPKVAELPTCQNTLAARAPLIRS